MRLSCTSTSSANTSKRHSLVIFAGQRLSVTARAGEEVDDHCNAHNTPSYRRLRRKVRPQIRSTASARAANSAAHPSGNSNDDDVAVEIVAEPKEAVVRLYAG